MLAARHPARAQRRSMDNPQLSHVPVMKTGMLIRRPVAEVFEAFVNPNITTQFWFTRSSGRLESGKAVAFMPRYAWLRRTLALPDERQHMTDLRWLERLLQEGIFENDIPERFTHGYGAQPDEIGPFFAQYGLQMLTLAASEGIGGGIQAEVVEAIAADSRLREVALTILVQTATDPGILGMASHLLYMGQRMDEERSYADH